MLSNTQNSSYFLLISSMLMMHADASRIGSPTKRSLDKLSDNPEVSDNPERSPNYSIYSNPTATPIASPTSSPTGSPTTSPTGSPTPIPPHLFSSQLLASDGENEDSFGRSVAVSGDGRTTVVGAPFDDKYSGSVYLFLNSFAVERKFGAPDDAASDWFGMSVAVSDDGHTFIVGAPADDTEQGKDVGSAYIFQKKFGDFDTGTKLVPYDSAKGDYDSAEGAHFGTSVAVSDDGHTFVVGAPRDDDNGDASGSAYVFQIDVGVFHSTKLVADDAEASEYFGSSVAVSGDGDTIVVGSPNGYDAHDSGSVYVFQKDGLGISTGTKLVADDAAVGDKFGSSVAVSDNGGTIVVGARGADDNGSTYVFQKQIDGITYAQETKLVANDGAKGDEFGSSVAVSDDGDTIVVGADKANGANSSGPPPQAGAAHVFHKKSGAFDTGTKLVADSAETGGFGSSVALSGNGDTIVVGSPHDDYRGALSGSAYVFSQ